MIIQAGELSLQMPTKNYYIIRNYVMEVTRDLVARGILRRKRGETLEQIISAEGSVVVGEITHDLKALATELGISLISTGSSILEAFAKQKVDSAVNTGKDAVVDFLAKAFSGKGKTVK